MTDWTKVEEHARQQAKELSAVSEAMGELKRRFALTIDLEGHYEDWKKTGIDNIINPSKEARYKLDHEEQIRRHEAAQKAIAEQRRKRSAEKGDGGIPEQHRAEMGG